MIETIALLCTVVGFALVFVALIQADRASRRRVERRRGPRTPPYRYSVDRRPTAFSNPKKPSIAALSMRQVLVQRARSRHAVKRGGAPARVTLDDQVAVEGSGDRNAFGAARDVELLALDEALTRLSALDPELVKLVELRYFGGLTVEETAEAMGSSPATVKRHWAVARAWQKRALDDPTAAPPARER